MKALLDTHAFLWWITDDPRLSGGARRVISDPGSRVFFSAASAWEIAIKARLGRLQIKGDLERACAPGAESLLAPISANGSGTNPSLIR